MYDKAFFVQVNALMLLKSYWTEKQRRIYIMYKKMASQAQVADGLNITQQTVSKTLRTIKAEEVMLLEKKLLLWSEKQ